MWEPAEKFVSDGPACAAPGAKVCDVCGKGFAPRNSQQKRHKGECSRLGNREWERNRCATPEYRERDRKRKRASRLRRQQFEMWVFLSQQLEKQYGLLKSVQVTPVGRGDDGEPRRDLCRAPGHGQGGA